MIGSYLLPISSPPVLTLTQFLQTLFVGITGLPGDLVRPKWQIEPPKQPDVMVDWIGIGIDIIRPDANGYLWSNPLDTTGTSATYDRMEAIEVGVAIYGPNSIETYGYLRDGFEIPQNRFAMDGQRLGFVEIGPGLRIPELIDERFYNRVQTTVYLQREIRRTYSIPTLISAGGKIYTDTYANAAQYLVNWKTNN